MLSQDSIPLHDRLVMISNVLPYGAKAVLDERTNGSVSVNLVFRILVRRDHLLEDLRQCLYATLASNVDTLQLPLQ